MNKERIATVFLIVLTNTIGATVILPMLPLYVEKQFGVRRSTCSSLAYLQITATDNAGNTATASVTFTIVADINSLIAMEQRACSLGWIDGDGVCNSLEAKLLAAKASIDRGRFNTAKNQLNAFIAELDAQKDKKVTQGYDVLKADTIYVVNSLP